MIVEVAERLANVARDNSKHRSSKSQSFCLNLVATASIIEMLYNYQHYRGRTMHSVTLFGALTCLD